MNGYLQCLIDRYERLTKGAFIPGERNIYAKVLMDLIGLQKFYKNESETAAEDITKKLIALDFVGTMPGLMEYLKNLSSKEGE